MYQANNGKRFFDAARQIKDGVLTKNCSYNPLWAIKGEDGQPSWAMDHTLFLNLRGFGVHTVVFQNKRTGERFSVAYETFEEFGKVFNVGHGLQIALPFQFWTVEQGERPKMKIPKKVRVPKSVKPAKSWLQRSFL